MRYFQLALAITVRGFAGLLSAVRGIAGLIFAGPCLAGLCLMGGLSLAGCGPETPVAQVSSQGEGSGVDHAPVDLPYQSRATRRLTVDMLQAAIPLIAGDDLNGKPITWAVPYRNQQIDALSDLALGPTLGHPDYVTITNEPAEPNMLYLKFMDDMARDVCPKILDADYARPSATTRTLLRFADLDTPGDVAQTNANLRYLKLKFHGEKITDDAGVAPLKAVFDAGVAAAGSGSAAATQARQGWNAVCVALFLDPAFHIY